MGLTEYHVDLTADDYLRMRVVSERGTVISFTVQYEAVIGGRVYPVVRYDSAHNMPHRDVLDHTGHNIDKHWFPGWDNAAVLNYARRDLGANWPRYRADFTEGIRERGARGDG